MFEYYYLGYFLATDRDVLGYGLRVWFLRLTTVEDICIACKKVYSAMYNSFEIVRVEYKGYRSKRWSFWNTICNK